jgi:hypothetical protein
MMIMIQWAHPLKMMIVNPILRPSEGILVFAMEKEAVNRQAKVQKVAVNRQALQRHGIF